MQTEYTISENLHVELEKFLTGHDIALLNQNLRRMLVDFLDYELRTGVPLYFDGFFYPFNSLLDVLNVAAEEQQSHKASVKATQQPAINKIMPLEKVIAFIKASLNPESLFLLHQSINKNKQEFFDLMVVIPSSSKTRFIYYEQVLSMANIEDVVINVSLHKAELLEQQLREGHIYYSIVCNKENLIYSTNGFEFPKNNPEVLTALAEKAITEFNSAHKKADDFLEGASNYRAESNNEMTAFMLQQAVELVLRGIITALSGSCVKTHYFDELKKPLKRYLPSFDYIISKNEKEEERLLHVLEKAYLESRYSHQLHFDDKDIDVLSETVELLHERAKTLFMERITTIIV